MIWQIIIIICIAVLIFLLVRKMPSIIKLNLPKLSKKDFMQNPKDVNTQFDTKTENVVDNTSQKIKTFHFFGKVNNDQALFEEADRLFKDNKLNEAEKIYLKIATNNPQNVKVYNRLGVIYMEKRNFSDARDAFAEAVRLDPQKASRHYNLAMASIELKEYRNAVESIEKAIKLENKNEKYKKLLIDLKNKIKYRYKEMKRTDD